MIPIIAAIVAAIGAGILGGMITGLTPGLHVNTVAALMLGSAGFWLAAFSPLTLACFLVALGVTHVFLDTLPSIFLGAPNEATALGVLPGHRYLKRGLGLMAVKLSSLGSLAGLCISIVFFPLFAWIVRHTYAALENGMGVLLLLAAVSLVMTDQRWKKALPVFLLSGMLGMVVLHRAVLSEPLLPLLSGLFGCSTLLISIREKTSIPKQCIMQTLKLRPKPILRALGAGQCCGFVTAVLPGLGSSAAATLALQLVQRIGDHGFLFLLGVIQMTNFVLGFAALHELGKARNGVVAAMQQLQPAIAKEIPVFLGTALVAGGIAFGITIIFGKQVSMLISKLSYQRIAWSVLCFLVALVFFRTGWYGLLLLATSTMIGLLSPLLKVRRTHAMGCLLVPVIVRYLWYW